MGDWLGAALLGFVGSSGDDLNDPVTAAHDGDGSTSTKTGTTGEIETPATGTEIEAAPAIDDEPVFTARSEE